MLVPANRRMVRTRVPLRGLGDVLCSASQDPEFDNCTLAPCYTPAGQGVPCPAVTSVDVCDKKPGALCFQFPFPWVGKIANCKCTPAFDVPAPWGKYATIALLALGGWKLVQRGMR